MPGPVWTVPAHQRGCQHTGRLTTRQLSALPLTGEEKALPEGDLTFPKDTQETSAWGEGSQHHRPRHKRFAQRR